MANSPNDRFQQLFHPWTNCPIVPLFALANAGITVSPALLARAFASPVTLGMLLGYVVGKPLGTVSAAWILAWASRGRIRPSGRLGLGDRSRHHRGIRFIVSLLIASLAFRGAQLVQAKVAILSAALGGSILTWLVFRATALLPAPLRLRALAGTTGSLIDLAVPVDQ